MKKKFLLVLMVVLGMFLVTACGNPHKDEPQYEIYELAVEAGYEGTYEEWLASIKGEKGDKGDKGDTGEQGPKGDKGDKGEAGAKGDKGEAGAKGDKGETGAKGDKGEPGAKGDKGEAGAKGDKGETGAKGDKGEAGAKGDQGPKGDKGDKGEAGAKGETGAKGDKGDQGEKGEAGANGLDGKSAYEIYKAAHPEYKGTEAEWLRDLVNGTLAEKKLFTVKFDSDKGTAVEDQKVEFGHKVAKPKEPTKKGHNFLGWYVGEDKWVFNGYSVSEDMTITAKWEKIPGYIPTEKIADVDNAKELGFDDVTTYGYVVAVSARGFVIADGTGAIYVDEKPASYFVIGDTTLKVTGAVSTLNKGKKLISAKFNEDNNTAVAFPSNTQTVLDKAKLDEIAKAEAVKAELVKVTGVLDVVRDANSYYFDIKVEGSPLVVRIAEPVKPEALKLLDGKKVEVVGYTNNITTKKGVNYLNVILKSNKDLQPEVKPANNLFAGKDFKTTWTEEGWYGDTSYEIKFNFTDCPNMKGYISASAGYSSDAYLYFTATLAEKVITITTTDGKVIKGTIAGKNITVTESAYTKYDIVGKVFACTTDFTLDAPVVVNPLLGKTLAGTCTIPDPYDETGWGSLDKKVTIVVNANEPLSGKFVAEDFMGSTNYEFTATMDGNTITFSVDGKTLTATLAGNTLTFAKSFKLGSYDSEHSVNKTFTIQ